MNTYYIEERGTEMTYIELRLLLFIDCSEKYERITKILNFLNQHSFINHLTMLYSENMRAENLPEKNNVMSLTIDMRNDKMRFKFWNGASSIWLFHTEDLFDALDTGREKFQELYDKYEPVTELLYNFKKKWETSIYHLYYDYNQDGFDITYNFVFTSDVKDTNFASKILDKLNKELIMLGNDITDDLNFNIKHTYQEVGCSACEKARRERELNEDMG